MEGKREKAGLNPQPKEKKRSEETSSNGFDAAVAHLALLEGKENSNGAANKGGIIGITRTLTCCFVTARRGLCLWKRRGAQGEGGSFLFAWREKRLESISWRNRRT